PPRPNAPTPLSGFAPSNHWPGMETNFLDALKVLIAQHAFQGEPMPAIAAVSTTDVPSPWAAVVVNSGSMTANLEECYGDRILLTLLGDDIHVPDKTLGRAVILRTERGLYPWPWPGFASTSSGSHPRSGSASWRPSRLLVASSGRRGSGSHPTCFPS